jgi:hypothetical protein
MTWRSSKDTFADGTIALRRIGDEAADTAAKSELRKRGAGHQNSDAGYFEVAGCLHFPPAVKGFTKDHDDGKNYISVFGSWIAPIAHLAAFFVSERAI